MHLICSVETLVGTMMVRDRLLSPDSSNSLVIDCTDFEELFGDDAGAIIEELDTWNKSVNCKRMNLDGNEPSQFFPPTRSPERILAALGVVP